MARMQLADGTEVPIVKPHLGDQIEFERVMRRTNKKYTAADFREDMQLSGYANAFAIWASLKRAGKPMPIEDILSIDLESLGVMVKREDGDPTDEEPDEDEGEGEQTPDPQSARTGDDAVSAPSPGSSSTD